MKLYADLPGRRLAQVFTDLAVVGWVVLCAWLGRLVHGSVMALAAPARSLEAQGSGFADSMTQASQSLTGLPIVDDRLAAPFSSLAGTGRDFESTGRDIAEGVENLALVLGWVTALVPVTLVVAVWLVVRLRFARQAAATQRLIDAAPDLDLFALRAMARQPMTRIARVSSDPAGAWRQGEGRTIRALALLELRASGLHPPSS